MLGASDQFLTAHDATKPKERRSGCRHDLQGYCLQCASTSDCKSASSGRRNAPHCAGNHPRLRRGRRFFAKPTFSRPAGGLSLPPSTPGRSFSSSSNPPSRSIAAATPGAAARHGLPVDRALWHPHHKRRYLLCAVLASIKNSPSDNADKASRLRASAMRVCTPYSRAINSKKVQKERRPA